MLSGIETIPNESIRKRKKNKVWSLFHEQLEAELPMTYIHRALDQPSRLSHGALPSDQSRISPPACVTGQFHPQPSLLHFFCLHGTGVSGGKEYTLFYMLDLFKSSPHPRVMVTFTLSRAMATFTQPSFSELSWKKDGWGKLPVSKNPVQL